MASRSHDQTEQLQLLGGGRLPTPESPSASLLEAFPNRFPQRPYVIAISFPEYTSLCPVTGQPDFGTIVLEYIPDTLCVESKSLKLYLFAFRNHQSFMETTTNTILDDICSVISPCWCRVRGLFVPRGGTRIDVFAEQYKDLPSPKAELVREAVAAWRSEPYLIGR